MTPIYGFPGNGFRRLNLTNNTPEEIWKELQDANTIRLIASCNDLATKDLATVEISQENGELELYQIGVSGKAFKVMEEQLGIYAKARDAGHTREFCLAAITNRPDLSTISDPFLRAFLKERPMLPAGRVIKLSSVAYTNKAGDILSQGTTTSFVNGKFKTTNSTEIQKIDEVGREITYVLIDGEIAWEYQVQFKSDGSVRYLRETRYDAKEFDPKYGQAIKDANDQATAGMKKQGIQGRGSVHLFWSLVQKKLKEKGIDWHSPAELNPNARFD